MIAQLLSPLAWGSPLGIGIFLILLNIAFFLFSLSLKNLDSINKKKK